MADAPSSASAFSSGLPSASSGTPVAHSLPALAVFSHHVPEVLRAVLSCVVFQRSLGALSPAMEASALFPAVVYPAVADAASRKRLEESIRRVCENVEDAHAQGSLDDGQRWEVVLSFYERRAAGPNDAAKAPGGGGLGVSPGSWGSWFLGTSPTARDGGAFLSARPRSPSMGAAWETWLLPLDLFRSSSSGCVDEDVSAELGVALRRTLEYVCARVNAHLAHVPPVTSRDAVSYAFDVTAAPASHKTSAGHASRGLGIDVMRRFLASTPPKGDLL